MDFGNTKQLMTTTKTTTPSAATMTTEELLRVATARPWRYHLGRGANPRYHIQTSAGYQIASTTEVSRHEAERLGQEANAELIVRAVSSFEAMREALRTTEAALTRTTEALREMIVEARERNRAAGQTVFNPAALEVAIDAIGHDEGCPFAPCTCGVAHGVTDGAMLDVKLNARAALALADGKEVA